MEGTLTADASYGHSGDTARVEFVFADMENNTDLSFTYRIEGESRLEVRFVLFLFNNNLHRFCVTLCLRCLNRVHIT